MVKKAIARIVLFFPKLIAGACAYLLLVGCWNMVVGFIDIQYKTTAKELRAKIADLDSTALNKYPWCGPLLPSAYHTEDPWLVSDSSFYNEHIHDARFIRTISWDKFQEPERVGSDVLREIYDRLLERNPSLRSRSFYDFQRDIIQQDLLPTFHDRLDDLYPALADASLEEFEMLAFPIDSSAYSYAIQKCRPVSVEFWQEIIEPRSRMEAEAQQAQENHWDYYHRKLDWADIFVLGYILAAGIGLVLLLIGMIRLYRWAKTVDS